MNEFSKLDRALPCPLFLTPHSLSSKTAFGVLTRFLLSEYSQYFHVYWNSPESRAFDQQSMRIESFLFSRFSYFKRNPPSWLTRKLGTLGASWWKEDRLKPGKKQWLKEQLADRISAVYAAPTEVRECERMKDILMVLEKPFVLHLWDLLDNNDINSPALQWLLGRATHVLCVSEEMVRHLATIRQDARILRFSRHPSLCRARPSQSGSHRIVLTGHCRPYISGLKVLNDALCLLKRAGQHFELIYVGSSKASRQWSDAFDQKVKTTGFVTSGEIMDRVIAQNHIGFLPGPLEAPMNNPRSRFSIPSRVQDLLAAGLPLIATVHKESATADYLRMIGLADSIFNDAESIAERLHELTHTVTWRAASEKSQSAFTVSCQPQSNLSELLRDAATLNHLDGQNSPIPKPHFMQIAPRAAAIIAGTRRGNL